MREYLEPIAHKPDPTFSCWTCGHQAEWEERHFKCEGCSRTFNYDEVLDHYQEKQYDDEGQYAI